MSRVRELGWTVALVVTGILAIGFRSPLGAATTLIVTSNGGSWETSFKEAFVAPFERDTGVQVQMVLGDGGVWLTKLRASNGENPPYDLVGLSGDEIRSAVAAKLLQPMDTTQIAHWADLETVTNRFLNINGQVYAAPFDFGQVGLAYRSDKIRTKPMSWLDLWNPQYRGRVGLPPLSSSLGTEVFVGIIHTLGGSEANPADVQKAFAKLPSLKPNVVAYPETGGAIQTALAQGDVWLVPVWDGRALSLAATGVPVGFSYPKEGAIGSSSQFSIAAGTHNLPLAYKFMGYVLDPQRQWIFAKEQWYATSNLKTTYSAAFKARIATSNAAFAQLIWPNYDVIAQNLHTWVPTWDRIFGR